jgi:hypothetical protein
MKRPRALGAIGLSVLAGAWAVAACSSAFIDKLFDGPIVAIPESGGVDAPIARCELRHIPEQPSTADTADTPALTFAFETLRLDDREGEDGGLDASPGFDLDDACTCFPEEGTCQPPDGGAVPCDHSEGRDNAVGPLVDIAISLLVPKYGKQGFVTRKIDEGDFTVLLSISDWNGQPDDPRVSVALYMAGPLRNLDGGRVLPSRDGGDRWTIDHNSLTNGDALVGQDCTRGAGCVPKYRDRTAYVRGSELVARLSAPLNLATTAGPLDIELTGLTLVARIVREGALYRLEGELVGRWPTDKMLGSLARLTVVDEGLCKGSYYPDFKAAVCTAADIAADPAGDRKGGPCTALSAAFSFTAGPATFAIVSAPTFPANGCEDFRDTCP